MEKLKASVIFKGIAIGRIRYAGRNNTVVKRVRTGDPEEEIKKYREAVDTAEGQLLEIYKEAKKNVGELNAEIFNVHAMLLRDEDYIDSVENIIKTQGVNAEYAIAVTGDNFAELFESMEDEYFKARAEDIKGISDRLINILSKDGDTGCRMGEPSILISDELTPEETVKMDKSLVLGFVTRYGSVTSHTAILARTMNIPALSDVCVKPEWNGRTGIIDGINGEFIVDADDKTVNEYMQRRKELMKNEEDNKKLVGLCNETKSGRHIMVYSNIANVSDVVSVLSNDSEGIGLLRSEFLYMEKTAFPDEDTQFAAYRKVAESMGGRKVIIRTMDIGSDKKLAYFNPGREENPAMGYRAVRICLDRRDIFKTQLRAIYRASAYGNISVMYPMITSEWELIEIGKIEDEVRSELAGAGVRCEKIPHGIMIETPAAAIISDRLGRWADFFSIGTNDLIQYTLAADRGNLRIAKYCDPHHEAVMRLIKMVIDNGHKNGIWVGICGELASDVSLTDTFIDWGVDELSVAPVFNLCIRRKVREHE